MECTALTGISPEVIKDLRSGKARTLELHSTHNVITLNGVEPGMPIFLTSINRDDLTIGDQGIVADVIGIMITMKRLIDYSPGVVYEERERMSARVKIKFCCNSAVKTVFQDTMFTPIRIDVVKCCSYHAG
ncbi:MAG: DUF473 domain-containing protein [Methanomicrobiales archaeon]|nr:DUF473 domain-containing protein [Methanomicrobiales archaeon]